MCRHNYINSSSLELLITSFVLKSIGNLTHRPFHILKFLDSRKDKLLIPAASLPYATQVSHLFLVKQPVFYSYKIISDNNNKLSCSASLKPVII